MISKAFGKLLHLTLRLSKYAAVAIIAILFVVALLSRNMRTLEVWHTEILNDFSTGSDISTFEEYLLIEENLFKQAAALEIPESEIEGRSRFNRYIKDGIQNPARFPQNWNRSFEFIPEDVKGGILLIHGLSDSPYSLRATAEKFRDRGYYVLGLRLPGHGTFPSGLLGVKWQDWIAAVKIAARHIQNKVPKDKPLLFAGYSCGGALALHHISETIVKDIPRRIPSGLLLFSPAVEISPLAVVSNWHKLFTWIPGFEKNAWLNISMEIDPYKYTSFTKNAGAQMHALSRKTQRLLNRIESDHRLPEFPSTLTFQSLVDSTIRGEAVVSELYEVLHAANHKLVLFDINHSAGFEGLIAEKPIQQMEKIIRASRRGYTLKSVTNRTKNSVKVIGKTFNPGKMEFETETLSLGWPRQVFSLSHVAIPIPKDDPVYGDSDLAVKNGMLQLGSLALRGETALLSLDTTLLLRLRHNPFYAVIDKEIDQFVSELE